MTFGAPIFIAQRMSAYDRLPAVLRDKLKETPASAEEVLALYVRVVSQDPLHEPEIVEWLQKSLDAHFLQEYGVGPLPIPRTHRKPTPAHKLAPLVRSVT